MGMIRIAKLSPKTSQVPDCQFTAIYSRNENDENNENEIVLFHYETVRKRKISL